MANDLNTKPPSEERFTAADLSRIEADTFVRQIDYHKRLGSTNDLSLELASRGDLRTPLLVVTDQQTRGRGRGANRWWSAPGALTFSILIDMPQAKAASCPPPQIALAAGLSGCLTIDAMLPDHRPGLKWPNDVLLNGRKLCGILIEASRSPIPRVVLGVGINVNNSLDQAPPEVRDIGISLFDATGRTHSRTEVLVRFLMHLSEKLELVADRNSDVIGLCRHYCVLHGQTVECHWGKQRIRGRCRGIDDDGALSVETDNGVKSCYSGEVHVLTQRELSHDRLGGHPA